MNDLTLFKKAINFLDKLVDEVKLEFKDGNITVNTMDPSRIMLFELTLKDIWTGGDGTFEINTDDLCKVLKVIKWDHCEAQIVDEGVFKNHKKIVFSKNKRKMELFGLNTFDYELVPMDSLRATKYDVKFERDAKDFKEILDLAEVYSGIITMKYEGEAVQMESKSLIGKFVDGDEIKGNNSGSYNIRHLKQFYGKGVKGLFVEPFKFSLRKDHPLKIEYNSSVVDLEYFIAPRVKDPCFDDDDDLGEF